MNSKQQSEILKLDQQICFPLYASSRLIIQSYEFVLEELNLTYPQYLVLLVLWEKDGQTVKEIGEKLLLDSGTLTPLLKKLQSQKCIERRRSKNDDRLVQNFLLPKGIKLKPLVAQAVFDLFCKSGIESKQALQIRTSLHKLTQNLISLRKSQTSKRNSHQEHN